MRNGHRDSRSTQQALRPIVRREQITATPDWGNAHAGADLRAYKPYLEEEVARRLRRVGGAGRRARGAVMREAMKNLGMEKVVGVDGDPVGARSRNWNSDRRLREQEADGWVAEVIFPNTQPPFAPLPRAASSRRLRPETTTSTGPRAYRARNRWLADYVSAAPAQPRGPRRSSFPTSRGRSRRSSGPPSTTSAAGSCSRARPPGRVSSRSTRPTTSRSGTCAKRSRCR